MIIRTNAQTASTEQTGATPTRKIIKKIQVKPSQDKKITTREEARKELDVLIEKLSKP